MEGKRIYLQPVGTVINAICDLIEIQKGKETYSDPSRGKVSFLVKMYAYKWEIRFSVTDIGKNRCQVQLEIGGEGLGQAQFIQREFALLDTFLTTLAEIEISEQGGVL